MKMVLSQKIARLLVILAGSVIFFGGQALAQDVRSYKPQPIKKYQTPPQVRGPQAGTGSDDPTPLIRSLKGVVIVGKPGAIRRRGTRANGVVVRDSSVFVPDIAIRAIENHLGAALSLKSLGMLTKEVVLAYRSADLPIVNVVAPEQDISNGVLQLVIVTGRVGQVSVEGNRYFSSDIYLRNVTLQPGEIIRGGDILDDLRYLNRNPFRRVDAIYAPGRSFGSTDIILKPYEYRPIMLYAGIENSGNETLGEQRIYLGAMASNLLGLDEVVGYQLTTLPEFENLFAHVGTFSVPIAFRTDLQLVGAHVTSNSRLNEDFTSSGESSQLAAYLVSQLPRLAGIAHDIKLGIEFKSSNNDLEFGGLTVTDTTSEIYQGVLGYAGETYSTYGQTRFNATVYVAPGGVSGHNESDVFQQIRFKADADYVYARFGIDHRVDLPSDFRLLASFDGQISSTNLLGSESLTLGGVGSVRGFENNIARGDEGFLANVTLYGPGVPIIGPYQKTDYLAGIMGTSGDVAVETVSDQLRPYVFLDYGWGTSKYKLPGEEDVRLAGAGVGLVYEMGRYISADIAYGWQLIDDGISDAEDGRLHFRVTLRH